MDAEELNTFARIRAQLPDAPIKKIIKDFYRIANDQVHGEELLAAHEIFLLDLGHLASSLAKSDRLKRVTQVEMQGYEAEDAAIEKEQAEIVHELALLKQELAVAQLDRANKIIYDALATTINKLPSRSVAEESNAKLLADVQALEEEQTTYAATWGSRQEAFDQIVNGLAAMSESIREEKSEQARRRALDEEEDEEEDPTASAAAILLGANPSLLMSTSASGASMPLPQPPTGMRPVPIASDGVLDYSDPSSSATMDRRRSERKETVEEGAEESDAMEGVQITNEGDAREEGEEGEEREEGEVDIA